MIRIIFEVLCACAASASFGIAFQLRGKKLLAASITGAIGWLAYLICDLFGFSAISCSFFATIVIAAISELLARRMHAPATIFLAVSLIPLVPGSGLYDTMEYCISGQTMLASTTGLHTLGIAAALAMGIVVVSSTVRMLSLYENKTAKN